MRVDTTNKVYSKGRIGSLDCGDVFCLDIDRTVFWMKTADIQGDYPNKKFPCVCVTNGVMTYFESQDVWKMCEPTL